MNAPLMPKATAVWLIENTALTFDQISEFVKFIFLKCKLLQMQGKCSHSWIKSCNEWSINL